MIDPITNQTPILQNSAVSKTENSENADLFKQLLGKASQRQTTTMETISSAQNNKSTEALSEITSIREISINDPISEIETKTDELLDKLDLYLRQLENPQISLKDINDLLEEINTNAGNLLKNTQDTSSADKDLMDIVSECAITAHSEYIKFQRGDYIEEFA